MTNRKTNLVPIGRFSTLTRLSMKALRLYDQNGLLPPSLVDASSGYRHYDLGQVRHAEIIRILRSVDMPLEEIRAFVGAVGDAMGHERLVTHRERLAKRLAAQKHTLAALDSLIRHPERLTPYKVDVVDQAAICARD